jgi:hypothetical protein
MSVLLGRFLPVVSDWAARAAAHFLFAEQGVKVAHDLGAKHREYEVSGKRPTSYIPIASYAIERRELLVGQVDRDVTYLPCGHPGVITAIGACRPRVWGARHSGIGPE